MIKNAIALIPAFNEEKNIKDVIARSRPFFPEILVSDDGSTDDTVALAEKSGAVVVMHTVNLGKGAAIKTGMEYILKNRPSVKYIVIIDADLHKSRPFRLFQKKQFRAKLAKNAKEKQSAVRP